MRRIVLLGAGGAGKSTLARSLGQRLGIPVIHLDRAYWNPGWVETPREVWVRRQEGFLAGEAWIVDGNYGGTLDLRLARADTVILLDLPRVTCLLRVLRRSLRRAPRPDMAPGCPERWDLDYLRFLWWVWTYPSRRRPDLLRRLAALPPSVRVIRLRSARDGERWLAALPPPAAGSRQAPQQWGTKPG